MKKLHFLKIITLFLMMSSLIAACSTTSPTPVPTIDEGKIIAAAVNTMSAKMTDEAIRNPSPTPFPTQTPVPPTATPIPPTETPAFTVEPTQAATLAPALSALLRYVTTFPEDKRVYVPNEEYGLALGFENTGTVTWEAGTYVKLISFKGEVTVQTQLSIDKTVKPGERVEFALWAFGSETLGDHTFVFQMYTPGGLAVSGGYATYSYVAK